MPEGRRLILVVEYEAEKIDPETMHEIGDIVRRRLIFEEIAGAVYVSAHALVGNAAYRVVELLPPRA